MRSITDGLRERIEEVEAERDNYKKEIFVVRAEFIKQKKTIGVLKE